MRTILVAAAGLVAGRWIEAVLSRWPKSARLLRAAYITALLLPARHLYRVWDESSWPILSAALACLWQFGTDWWWIGAVFALAYVLDFGSPTRGVLQRFEQLLDLLSGQRILDVRGTNGGDVVVLRAVMLTLTFSVVAVMLKAWIHPQENFTWSLQSLQGELVELAGWISGFFGAAYLALYTRFVSQWSYLANVYNLIKQAEAAEGAQTGVITEWKAGFLEDADHLHLVGKKSLAPIIKHWAEDKAVATAFLAATPGGQTQLDRIWRRADVLYSSLALAERNLPAASPSIPPKSRKVQ